VRKRASPQPSGASRARVVEQHSHHKEAAPFLAYGRSTMMVASTVRQVPPVMSGGRFRKTGYRQGESEDWSAEDHSSFASKSKPCALDIRRRAALHARSAISKTALRFPRSTRSSVRIWPLLQASPALLLRLSFLPKPAFLLFSVASRFSWHLPCCAMACEYTLDLGRHHTSCGMICSSPSQWYASKSISVCHVNL
jgi:hypothetical protein